MPDIIEQLILLSIALIVGVGVILAQLIALSRRYRSLCWWLYSAAFLLLTGIQVWSLLKLPVAILKAQTLGQLPESLNAEQWINIAVRFAFVGLIIAANDVNRRTLDSLGIGNWKG